MFTLQHKIRAKIQLQEKGDEKGTQEKTKTTVMGIIFAFVVIGAAYLLNDTNVEKQSLYWKWQQQLEWHEQSTNVLISLEPENEHWKEQLESIRNQMDGESRMSKK